MINIKEIRNKYLSIINIVKNTIERIFITNKYEKKHGTLIFQ